MASQESKVTELQTDMKWIKENITRISQKVDTMYDTFQKGEGKINSLNRRVYGDGSTEGIIEKTQKLEDYLSKLKGGLVVLKIFVVSLSGAVVFLIGTLFEMWKKLN